MVNYEAINMTAETGNQKSGTAIALETAYYPVNHPVEEGDTEAKVTPVTR